DNAGGGVDGKAAAGIVAERVRHEIGRASGRESGDGDSGAVGGAFRNATARGAVGIDRRGRINVGDLDGEGLRGGGASSVGGLNRDGVAGVVLVVELGRIRDGDNAGGGVDGKAAAGIVAERVRHGRARSEERRGGEGGRGRVGGGVRKETAGGDVGIGRGGRVQDSCGEEVRQ